jgi:branched-chain amino acid transport system permease protein
VITTVLGGLGSLSGSVLGTLVVQLLPEFFRKFSEYRMLAYGIAVVLVILLRPAGLMGYMELPDLIKKISKKKSTGGA